MEVDSYKKKRGNLYTVIFDNGAKYDLYDDIILKYELLIEKKIDKKKLEKILSDNAILEVYYKALKYINIKMRTQFEIRKYLSNAQFSKKTIDYAIKRLREEGYIDEERYAEAFINDAINLGLNGPRKIQDNLRKLGLNEVVIEKYLSRVSEEIWKERIIRILDKKAKVNRVGLVLFKKKMYSELTLQGYLSQHISEVLEGYEIDTTGAFLREAEKVYVKLARKYKDTELELYFKNKMYQKGFDADMIIGFLEEKR